MSITRFHTSALAALVPLLFSIICETLLLLAFAFHSTLRSTLLSRLILFQTAVDWLWYTVAMVEVVSQGHCYIIVYDITASAVSWAITCVVGFHLLQLVCGREAESNRYENVYYAFGFVPGVITLGVLLGVGGQWRQSDDFGLCVSQRGPKGLVDYIQLIEISITVFICTVLYIIIHVWRYRVAHGGAQTHVALDSISSLESPLLENSPYAKMSAIPEDSGQSSISEDSYGSEPGSYESPPLGVDGYGSPPDTPTLAQRLDGDMSTMSFSTRQRDAPTNFVYVIVYIALLMPRFIWIVLDRARSTPPPAWLDDVAQFCLCATGAVNAITYSLMPPEFLLQRTIYMTLRGCANRLQHYLGGCSTFRLLSKLYSSHINSSRAKG